MHSASTIGVINLSKKHIASALQAATGLSGAKANDVAGELLQHIVDTLKTENEFSFPGIGTLTVRNTKPRNARNPKTGAAIKVPAGRTVRFKISGVLKQNVNT